MEQTIEVDNRPEATGEPEAVVNPTESKYVEEGQGEESKLQSAEEAAAEARYKARVAEIEAELASDRLRRSRQVELEA